MTDKHEIEREIASKTGQGPPLEKHTVSADERGRKVEGVKKGTELHKRHYEDDPGRAEETRSRSRGVRQSDS